MRKGVRVSGSLLIPGLQHVKHGLSTRFSLQSSNIISRAASRNPQSINRFNSLVIVVAFKMPSPIVAATLQAAALSSASNVLAQLIEARQQNVSLCPL